MESRQIKLGGYIILRKLGNGAFGVVYLCKKDGDDSKNYAMKTIKLSSYEEIDEKLFEADIQK